METLKFLLQITTGKRYFCMQISENRPTYWDFEIYHVDPPTSPNF